VNAVLYNTFYVHHRGPYPSKRFGRGKRYRVFAFTMDFFGRDGSGGWLAGLEAAQDGAREVGPLPQKIAKTRDAQITRNSGLGLSD
jgi:hypothetical protein